MMNEYKIEIYYKYEVNTPADSIEGVKNQEQIQDAFLNFENGITHYIKSEILLSSSMPLNGDRERRIVSIKTCANKSEVTKGVSICLKSLSLKGIFL